MVTDRQQWSRRRVLIAKSPCVDHLASSPAVDASQGFDRLGDRVQVVADRALEEAKRAIEEAKARLKIAVRDNRDLAKLDVEIAEARFDLSDLREIESNTLVLYTQQTGRAVIKEHDRVRQIELRARISKRLLGQERLPIGINRHLGQHFPIPVGMKVEVNQGEGK